MILQHHWVSKLLGFDFAIEYKPSATNTVAVALSWRDMDNGALLAISGPPFDFIERLHQAQATDPALVALHEMRSLWASVPRRGPSSMHGGK